MTLVVMSLLPTCAITGWPGCPAASCVPRVWGDTCCPIMCCDGSNMEPAGNISLGGATGRNDPVCARLSAMIWRAGIWVLGSKVRCTTKGFLTLRFNLCLLGPRKISGRFCRKQMDNPLFYQYIGYIVNITFLFYFIHVFFLK